MTEPFVDKMFHLFVCQLIYYLQICIQPYPPQTLYNYTLFKVMFSVYSDSGPL